MNADERVRHGLERNAASFTPDVELALRQVLQRRRTAFPRRPLVRIAAALVAVVALAAITRRGEQVSPTPPLTVPPHPAAATVERQFEAIVPAAANDVIADLAGRWRVRFSPDGTVAIEQPEQFEGTVTTPAAALSGHEFLTDLFSADLCAGHRPGRYHWSVAPWGDLNLAVLDDSCRTRTELLAGPGRTWTAPTLTPPPSNGF